VTTLLREHFPESEHLVEEIVNVQHPLCWSAMLQRVFPSYLRLVSVIWLERMESD